MNQQHLWIVIKHPKKLFQKNHLQAKKDITKLGYEIPLDIIPLPQGIVDGPQELQR